MVVRIFYKINSMGRKYGFIILCIIIFLISFNVKCVLNIVKSCGIYFIVFKVFLLYIKNRFRRNKVYEVDYFK